MWPLKCVAESSCGEKGRAEEVAKALGPLCAIRRACCRACMALGDGHKTFTSCL